MILSPLAVSFALLMAAGLGRDAQGPSNPLERVKALYAAAAYDDALAALPEAGGPLAGPAVEEFRALCLLALGREADAEGALGRALAADPTFAPTGADAPPRLVSAFERARLRMLPDLVNRSYAEAKRAFEGRDHQAAIAGFERVLALVDLAPEGASSAVEDVGLLATEFLDLTRARAHTPPPAPPAKVEEPASAAAGSLAPGVPLRLAVPVRQELPPWNPSDSIARTSTFDGVIRVTVGEDGRVRGVRVLKPSHPAYDTLLIQAARRWVYEPALRGGVAVSSQLDIEIRLRPR